jgi:hypothetical protein
MYEHGTPYLAYEIVYDEKIGINEIITSILLSRSTLLKKTTFVRRPRL